MKPAFSVKVGGKDVTQNFGDRLLSLSVIDQEGSQSDSVTIQLDDRNGIIAIPETGDKIAIALGYRETGLRDMGEFVVDSVTLNGWPQTMTIRGRAADLKRKLKSQRTKHYENKTISEIVSDIAKRHGLQGQVMGSLAKLKYDYIAQTGESDLHFLTRLGVRHDAIAAIKKGKVILCKKGEAGLGTITVTRPGQIISYSCQHKDRPKSKKAASTHYDRSQSVLRRQTADSWEDGEAEYEVPGPAHDGEWQADDMALSRAEALARDAENLQLVIVGDPDVMAEMFVDVIGVREGIDGLYRIKSVRHELMQDGYETHISTELPGKRSGKSKSQGGKSK